MSTSGLLVFALTRRANKQLQKQFISRAVQKRYVALIEGKLSETQGEIQLPLCGDLDDSQDKKCAGSKVSLHSLIGKPCKWSKTELVFTSTHIQDVPINCEYIAPSSCLNAPIVGDDLYGLQDKRLFLHAEQLSFAHPYTKQPMTFQVDADF